jgi:uncharacterized membrane protein
MRTPLLFVHISGGIIGLLSGTVAMIYRKGSHGHRVSGYVFVVAMLSMAAAAECLALMNHQMNNAFGGVLTLYLISTAWLTGRRRDGETSRFDWIALVFVLAIAAGILTFGAEVASGQLDPKDGVPVGMYFFLGSIALLSGIGDIRMVVRGGIFGKQRIARHLWRMCFGLFIATGSLFLGQQQVFPDFIRKSNLLFMPAILPLPFLIYWMIRIRFTRKYKKLEIATAHAT